MTSFNRRMDAIEAALASFESRLPRDRPADLIAFFKGRVELSRSVNEFLAGEWAGLANGIERGMAAPDRAAADRILRTFMDLRTDYSAHIVRWDSRAIAADWAGYRADCVRLVTGLRRLLRARTAAGQQMAA